LAQRPPSAYLDITPAVPPQHRRRTAKGAIMLYHLNRGLFVENGPTILAEQAREALAVSHAYRLFGTARPASPPPADETPLSAAA
jgi:hypothetical protein